MSTMHLDVVSTEQKLFDGEVEELFAPGAMGELGIMPQHTQLITTLKAGELRYKVDGQMASLFVAGGIMEVLPTGVTVLADTALRAEDLDEQAAKEAEERAVHALEGKDPEDLDYEKLQIELEAAKAQLEMIHKIGRTIRG